MAKAWMTGSKKPVHLRYIIFRYEQEGWTFYETKTEDGRVLQMGRAFAEHEVCSGAARYKDGRA